MVSKKFQLDSVLSMVMDSSESDSVFAQNKEQFWLFGHVFRI